VSHVDVRCSHCQKAEGRCSYCGYVLPASLCVPVSALRALARWHIDCPAPTACHFPGGDEACDLVEHYTVMWEDLAALCDAQEPRC
jgi:hypothetical protein